MHKKKKAQKNMPRFLVLINVYMPNRGPWLEGIFREITCVPGRGWKALYMPRYVVGRHKIHMPRYVVGRHKIHMPRCVVGRHKIHMP